MTEKRISNDGRLTEDELIVRLVADPSDVPDARTLFGFLGKSTREGCWRLYLSAALDEYLDIREEDIVHQHKVAPDQSTLGGTILWVKRGATLVHTQTDSRATESDFLQGGITAAFFRGARAGALLAEDVFGGLRRRNAGNTAGQPCPHSEFKPVCTLATSCLTTVPTDPGCGGGVFGF